MGWKDVIDIAFVDQMHSLGMQSNEVCAVLAILIALAGFNAEQVGVGAVRTFTQRYTDFGDGDVAGTANGEEVLALPVMITAGQIFIVLDKTEDAAPHENVRVGIVISLDLLEAFIRPVDAIPTVNHKIPMLRDA